MDLTRRQKDCLEAIKEHIQEYGYPPTWQELAKKMGVKQNRTVQKHLEALRSKGYVKILRGKARGIYPADFSPIKRIPVLGEVTAGKPIFAQENILGYLPVNCEEVPWEDAFFLKVKGDSMKEAGILDGDYALVKPQPTANKGEIVVALVNDEATVKYFYPEKNKITLKPANQAYEPISVTADEDFRIVGKVVGIFRWLDKACRA